jgi:creatinine amidohydrolase
MRSGGIMKIGQMNWSQVEAYLKRDDRAILPLGSTEQHAQLSLSVDAILAERVAVDAAEPLGVPVFPVVSYGVSPYFMSFPGTVTLRVETFINVVRDIFDCLRSHGFRRILIVNGHGGNAPAQSMSLEWMATHPEMKIRFHNWWNAPKTWAKVKAIDPVASHASWMENFPWTRLEGTSAPKTQKPMIDPERLRMLSPRELRDYIGDGNYGGYYERPDEELLAIWKIAVDETRDLIERGWP